MKNEGKYLIFIEKTKQCFIIAEPLQVFKTMNDLRN